MIKWWKIINAFQLTLALTQYIVDENKEFDKSQVGHIRLTRRDICIVHLALWLSYLVYLALTLDRILTLDQFRNQTDADESWMRMSFINYTKRCYIFVLNES